MFCTLVRASSRTYYCFITALIGVSLVGALHVDAAPFVNLDFEQSLVQPSDPSFVPAAAAFPGWTAEIGGVAQNFVYHDTGGIGEPVVALFDEPAQAGTMLLLQGQYMAYLETGTNTQRSSLSQVGDIPAGTKSITLLCDGGAGPPVVTLNGIPIEMIHLSGSTASHFINLYGGDVSAFAGSSAELRLQSDSFSTSFSGRRSLDDIRFSDSPLPEPAPYWIELLTSALLLNARSRNRQ